MELRVDGRARPLVLRTVDAVVIGAGPNGLVAANLLADAGWSVLVLEAHDAPGGSVRSAELTAPGFVNDVCGAFHPLGLASPVMREPNLESYGLRWRHARFALAHVLPDDRAALVSRDVEETAASVAQFAPSDAGAWRQECARWCTIRDEALAMLLRPFPPVRAAARLVRRVGGAEAMRLARMARGTIPIAWVAPSMGEARPSISSSCSAQHRDSAGRTP